MIDRLQALLKALDRGRYGRRSEKLDVDQHAFAFEEIETGLGAIEAKLDATTKVRAERPSRARKPLDLAPNFYPVRPGRRQFRFGFA